MSILDEAGRGGYAERPWRGVGECVPEPEGNDKEGDEPEGDDEEQDVAEQNLRAAACDPFEAAKAIAKAYDAMHGLSAPQVIVPLPNPAMRGVTVAKLMREEIA